MRNRKFHQRRGITLLFVVSMIVLFLLMGTTFVVVSNDFLRASKKRALADISIVDSPIDGPLLGNALVERAALEIIRGTSLDNTTSPLRGHSILADMYGYGFKGVVNGPSTPVPNDSPLPFVANIPETSISSQGQLIALELRSETGAKDYVTNLLTGTEDPLGDEIVVGVANEGGTPGRHNGKIMSFVSGPASGTSTRIVDYQITVDGAGDVTNRTFVISAAWSDGGSFSLADLEGSTVVINNRAFSGTGAGGFDPAPVPARDEGDPALEAKALKPNRIGRTREELTEDDDTQSDFPGFLSNFYGPNESYDAPDFQNMFLSGRQFKVSLMPLTTPNEILIPSFHRASLVGTTTMPGGDTNREAFSAFETPLVTDTNGDGLFDSPAVVDNDNDGLPDSIWMDIGLPIQSNGAGLNFKPLVAYHIVDLDSRLNLNTCGNLADMINGSPNFAGQGYGPAEISLSGFLGAGDYAKILQGDDYGTPGTAMRFDDISGRYGFGVDFTANTGDEVPGGSGRDEWSLKKLFGHPLGMATLGGFYASSPVDIRGRFSIATPVTSAYADLNDAAFNNSLPQTDFTMAVAADDIINSPYETNFAPSPSNRWEPGDDDQLFTADELQAVLRPFDNDANLLNQRLVNLVSTIMTDVDKRNSITTDSYEVPMAPFYTIDEMGETRSLLGLLRFKIRQATGATKNFEIDPIAKELLPAEMLAGLKMDINRPFGNGRDDDPTDPTNGHGMFFNGVIDDPLEPFIDGDPANATNGMFFTQQNLDQATAPDMDLDNDYVAGTNDDLARAEFAKHLYVLTLLACEENVTTTSLTAEPDYRRAIAQWAINVVDFRDPDSINTPFEFDLDPWNGWDVNGDLETMQNSAGNRVSGEEATPDRAVVWGAERPELLITETFAHHDRRTEDLGTDDGGMDDTAGGDTDFDSRLVPHSSLFIELYHPWTQDTGNQLLPSELAADPANPIGVDLQRRTPGNDPVWRIGVKVAADDTALDRSIYFTDVGTTPSNVTDGGEEFYTTLAIPPIEPGVFAVVGSAGPNPGGPGGYRTTFGRRTDADELVDLKLDETRSIKLVPSINPNDDQIVRYGWDLATTSLEETTSKGIAVVIDGPRSLSISDPDGGYPDFPATNPLIPVDDGNAYTIPLDSPLDASTALHPNQTDRDAIWNNGTTDAFRTIYLQRLANPLADWDADTNPYLTVDVSPVDLLAFNGVRDNPDNGAMPPLNEREADPGNGQILTSSETVFGSTERGESETTNFRMLFAREAGNPREMDMDSVPLTTADTHNLSFQFVETFGRTNDGYVMNGGTNRYAWLTWNNRPYVSQYELANVPYTSSEDLTAAFSLYDAEDPADDFDPYTASNPRPLFELGSRFGHLLNFYGHDSTVDPERGNFYRLFDYTEVPSRYVGTETWLNGSYFVNHPFNFLSHFRNPGKINLNTVSKETYEALMGDYLGELFYDDFNNSRWRDVDGKDFFRPYRNSSEGNFVPRLVPDPPFMPSPDELVEENIDCGLFRRGVPSADTESLFDFEDTTAAYNSERSAYFRNAMRQRLGNLVTTRSSVFAIWITIGYFEVDETGDLKTDPADSSKGLEIGAETGQVKRNRGFYIYDRSIPVAFEPGQNHNVERGILVKTIIE